MQRIRISDESRQRILIVTTNDNNRFRISSLQRLFPGATGLFHYREGSTEMIMWVKSNDEAIENDLISLSLLRVPDTDDHCLEGEWDPDITYIPFYPRKLTPTENMFIFHKNRTWIGSRPQSPTPSATTFFRRFLVVAGGE